MGGDGLPAVLTVDVDVSDAELLADGVTFVKCDGAASAGDDGNFFVDAHADVGDDEGRVVVGSEL